MLLGDKTLKDAVDFDEKTKIFPENIKSFPFGVLPAGDIDRDNPLCSYDVQSIRKDWAENIKPENNFLNVNLQEEIVIQRIQREMLEKTKSEGILTETELKKITNFANTLREVFNETLGFDDIYSNKNSEIECKLPPDYEALAKKHIEAVLNQNSVKSKN